MVRLVSPLEGPLWVVNEAGPTGHGPVRVLERGAVDSVVAAPHKIPRGATERVKADRRDAEQLVRMLLAGNLCPVGVPKPAQEALRDPVWAREGIRGDLMRARHRLSKLVSTWRW